MQKYGHDDARPVLERASARETAARVALGEVARQYLRQALRHRGRQSRGGHRRGRARPTGSCPGPADAARIDADPVRCLDPAASAAMQAEIDAARKDGDTLGGVVEVVAYGLPPGLGSHVHWDRRLDGRLAAALMSIQAIKGVEVGDGFTTARRRGSQAHDEIEPAPDGVRRRTNRAGGIEGGMSTGEPLRVRAAMKPISTVPRALATVDVRTGEAAKAINQRSDVTAVPAAGVVAEAMVALVLAGAAAEKFGGDSVAEVQPQRRRIPEIIGDHSDRSWTRSTKRGRPAGRPRSSSGRRARARPPWARCSPGCSRRSSPMPTRSSRRQRASRSATSLSPTARPRSGPGAGHRGPADQQPPRRARARRRRHPRPRHPASCWLATGSSTWRPGSPPRCTVPGWTAPRPLLLGNPQGRMKILLEERLPLYTSAGLDHRAHRRPRAARTSRPRSPGDRGGAGNGPADASDGAAGGPAELTVTRIPVGGEQPYEVVVGAGVLGELPSLIGPRASSVMVIAPRGPGRDRLRRSAARSRTPGTRCMRRRCPPGKRPKTSRSPPGLWSKLAASRITRTDAIVGVGGGAATDLAGFVAATWLRGVRVVLVPTTLLAMTDAAVGGKTAVDIPEGKNLVGTFSPPAGVLADLTVLESLPQPEYVSGLAEVIKAGFIADPVILELIEADPAGAVVPHGQHARELWSARCG